MSSVHPAAPVIARASAALAAAVGALVLLGWVVGSELLKGELRPGMIIMLPNTALGFLLAGVALLLQPVPAGARGRHAAVLGCSIAVLLLGALTFLERTTGIRFGIDLLLFREQLLTYPYSPPGQMASNSTVCFTLAGIGLLFLRREPWVGPLTRELAALAGLCVSGLALLGYLYGASPLYTFDRAAGMALVTALGFFSAHLALLLARPHRGAVALIAGSDLTARVTRPLLVAGIALPVASGWLWIWGREQRLFSREGGIALLTTVNLALLLAVVLMVARVLRGTDLRRQALLERERELRAVAEAARAEAEAANEVKTEFLATMSHELRTPLNAIIGYSSLMHEQVTGPITERQRRYLGRVKTSAQHLLSLIDQVLALARIDAGTLQLLLEPADAGRLAEEAVTIATPLFAGKPIRIAVEVRRDARFVTDAPRVRQILVSLLSNAAKFTASGEVRVVVEADGEGDGEGSGTVRFVVSDTGIGIAPENHERIFEPFWQVERTATRSFDGVGLGLSVSRELARRLGGELTVASRLGEGAAFFLSLPALPTPSPIPPSPDIYSAARTSQTST